MRTYDSYTFRSKDPVIDQLRTIIEDTHGKRVTYLHLLQIQESGGPTAKAMKGWFFGKVQRPQTTTVEACGRALGYRRVWQKMNGKGR